MHQYAQIFLVFCCIHLHIRHHMSKNPFLILSFKDVVVFVVTTLINPKKQRKCAISPTDVADIFRPAYLHYWRYETVR